MDSQETTSELKRSVFDWEDLQVFHAVATSGSMSAAAAILGCQQPTVSKRMQQLEARLGAQLIHRRSDGIVLTSAGEAAFDYVQTMQRSANRLESEISGLDKSLEGEVAVRISDGLATYWTARHLPRFMQINPDIELHMMKSGGVNLPGTRVPDLSVTFLQDKDMDSQTIALGTLHFVPMASREFIRTYGVPESTHDALNLRFLKLEPYNPQQDLWGNRVGVLDSYLEYGFHTDMSSVLFETMRAGGGIAMAPTYLAHLYPEELVFLDYGPRQDLRFWLKYQPESQRIDRIRCVGDWIVEIFDRKTNPWFRDEFCHPSEFCDVEVLRPKAK